MSSRSTNLGPSIGTLNNIKTTYYISAHGHIPVESAHAQYSRSKRMTNMRKKVPKSVHLWFQSQIGCLVQSNQKGVFQPLKNMENVIRSKSINNKPLNLTTFLAPGQFYADTMLVLKEPHKSAFPLGVFKRTIQNKKLTKLNINAISNTSSNGYQYILLSKLVKFLSESNGPNGSIAISVSSCRVFDKKPKHKIGKSLLLTKTNSRDIRKIQTMIGTLTKNIGKSSSFMPTKNEAMKILMLNKNISKINVDNLMELFRTKEGITNKKALIMVLMNKMKDLAINKRGAGLIHINNEGKYYVKQPCLFKSNCINQQNLNRLQNLSKRELLSSNVYRRTYFK